MEFFGKFSTNETRIIHSCLLNVKVRDHFQQQEQIFGVLIMLHELYFPVNQKKISILCITFPIPSFPIILTGKNLIPLFHECNLYFRKNIIFSFSYTMYKEECEAINIKAL